VRASHVQRQCYAEGVPPGMARELSRATDHGTMSWSGRHTPGHFPDRLLALCGKGAANTCLFAIAQMNQPCLICIRARRGREPARVAARAPRPGNRGERGRSDSLCLAEAAHLPTTPWPPITLPTGAVNGGAPEAS